MSDTDSPSLEPLSNDHWQSLLDETRMYTRDQVNRLRWRLDYGGVLPDGFDADAIAAQVLADVLHEQQSPSFQHSTIPAFQHGPSTIPLIHQSTDPAHHPTIPIFKPSVLPSQEHLHRLVRKHVNRLYHRRENWVLRNEPDLARTTDYDGDPISPVELLPDPYPDPARTFLEKVFDPEFTAFLGKDRRLKSLSRHIAAGLWKPRDLARKLKRRIPAVHSLRKRLKRKLLRFLAPRSSAEIKNNSRKV